MFLVLTLMLMLQQLCVYVLYHIVHIVQWDNKTNNQLNCVNISRVDNAFLVSLVGLRPEKHFWLGLSNQKNIDEFVWTKGSSVSFTHWNAGMPGMEEDALPFLKLGGVNNRSTIHYFSLQQLKDTNRAVWRWQLGFWLDSGICCLALIQQNTSANTWQRGPLWPFHHPLNLLPSVQKVGLEWEQETTAIRYNQKPRLNTRETYELPANINKTRSTGAARCPATITMIM